ncbi:hypothetical protein FRC18_008729 [Serendipita sp. 400]|nr:hypothetical protein FRC18_008729 [Serendipita sp. 400]
MPKHKLLKWLTKLFKIPSRKPSSQSRELQANLSKLPIELIEYILLSAAYDPDLLPLTLNLLRLSHWTQTLLQPFVYHTVSLHSDSQAQKFLWAITRRPELCKHVKEFCVPRVNIFKRAWPRHHVADLCLPYVAALDKGAPHLRTLAKIFPILFLEDPETADIMNPNASNASLQAVFSESEALKKMQDDRLILFNIREMVTLCKVSTERFWGEIEFRATCGEAHFILGQWRELAGRTLTG